MENEIYYSLGIDERLACISEKKYWNLLVKDSEFVVVQSFAEYIDEEPYLSLLSEHENAAIRRIIALKGYKPEKMVEDISERVRGAVAETGMYLERLKNDTSAYVRGMVAGQGYALDELKEDKNAFVRLCVKKYTGDYLKNTDPIEENIKKNEEFCILDRV